MRSILAKFIRAHPFDRAALQPVLGRRSSRIVIAATAAGVFTFAALSVVPARYTSQAQILVAQDAVAHHVKALQGRDLALRLAQDLKLEEGPELNALPLGQAALDEIGRRLGLTSEPSAKPAEARSLDRHARALRVSHVKGTREITVAYTAADRDLAAQAANRLAEIYLDGLRPRSVPPRGDGREMLKANLDRLAIDVASLEAEVDLLHRGVTPLEDQVRAKRRELEALRKSADAAREPIGADQAELISRARPALAPASPDRVRFALLAAAVTLIVAFALVGTRDVTTNRRGELRATAKPSRGPELGHGTRGAARLPAGREVGMGEPSAPIDRQARAAVWSADGGDFTSLAPIFLSIDDVAERLVANARGQGGYRMVMFSDVEGVEVREAAADLTATLAASGQRVVFIDWSLDGQGMSHSLDLEPSPGVMELLEGRASFEDAIRKLSEDDIHFIPCGRSDPNGRFDPDRANLVFDALDDAYDVVILTGEQTAIRGLLEHIEGRVDAAVAVVDLNETGAPLDLTSGELLGFDATNIDVVRLALDASERPLPHPQQLTPHPALELRAG